MVKRLKRRQKQKLHHLAKWRRELKRRQRPQVVAAGFSVTANTYERRKQSLTKHRKALLESCTTLSLTQNPSETLSFFSRLIRALHKLRPVTLDISNVRTLTIDALLYFLATVDRMKANGIPPAVNGNLPTHQEAHDKFKQSGFLRFVHSKVPNIATDSDTVQIYDGRDADPELAKKFCIFTMEKLNLERSQTKNLFDVVMEIIINTRQHAYPVDSKLPKWYAYAEYSRTRGDIEFTILDTGLGIPTTAKKKWQEILSAKFGLFSSQVGSSVDSSIIRSALNGDFRRTKTKEQHRGKGIPKINMHFQEGSIKDLIVISNLGYVKVADRQTHNLSEPLQGTLYSWRVSNAN